MQSNTKRHESSCPQCGEDNSQSSEDWLNGMEGGKPPRCAGCGETLGAGRSSLRSSIQKGAAKNFNVPFFIIVVLLSGSAVYLNRIFGVLTLKADSGQIVYELVLILLVGSALASGKLRQNLKYLGIWAGIFLVLLAGYSYRQDLSGIKEKIVAEIIPARGHQKASGTISFPVSSDGHFYIRAGINGIPVTFLVDTGASHIVLSPADAEKLGIKTDDLRFDRVYETANGTVRGSSIRINDLKIGTMHLEDIGASINEATMRNSLLGMTFFKRLKSYEVENDVLTLYWRE